MTTAKFHAGEVTSALCGAKDVSVPARWEGVDCIACLEIAAASSNEYAANRLARLRSILVDDAPKPAQDPYERIFGIKPDAPAPLAGIAPLVMAMEETLAHLHTVSAYVRNEKAFSATHAAVTRRLAQALREYKGGR